jgi:hypothetical protein
MTTWQRTALAATYVTLTYFWTAAALAQPYRGGLPQCIQQRDACTANLGVCSADLAESQANLQACSSELGSCIETSLEAQAGLAACSNTLGTCTAQRTALQGNLNLCTTQLQQAQTSRVLIFRYTGAEQSFTVPAGVTRFRVEAWGAGGGGGGGSTIGQPAGGGGGGGGASYVLAAELPSNCLCDPFVIVGRGGQGGGGGISWTSTVDGRQNAMYGGGGGGGSHQSRELETQFYGTSFRVFVAGGGLGGAALQGGAGGYGGGQVGGAGGANFGGAGGYGGYPPPPGPVGRNNNGGFIGTSISFAAGGRGAQDGAFGSIAPGYGGAGGKGAGDFSVGTGGTGQIGLGDRGSNGLVIVTFLP